MLSLYEGFTVPVMANCPSDNIALCTAVQHPGVRAPDDAPHGFTTQVMVATQGVSGTAADTPLEYSQAEHWMGWPYSVNIGPYSVNKWPNSVDNWPYSIQN